MVDSPRLYLTMAACLPSLLANSATSSLKVASNFTLACLFFILSLLCFFAMCFSRPILNGNTLSQAVHTLIQLRRVVYGIFINVEVFFTPSSFTFFKA